MTHFYEEQLPVVLILLALFMTSSLVGDSNIYPPFLGAHFMDVCHVPH